LKADENILIGGGLILGYSVQQYTPLLLVLIWNLMFPWGCVVMIELWRCACMKLLISSLIVENM